MPALVIVGHGSHLGPESSAPVYRHAARIRELGIFDEVRECFWKEEPSLREIFDLVQSDEVFVVPLFISEGYFTREVIPRELGLPGPPPSTVRIGARVIRYCAPVGTHPGMTRLVLRRAEDVAGLSAAEAGRAALIILGHGTDRNSNSADVIHRVTDEARQTGIFRTVAAGFLDQEPRARRVLDGVSESRVVLVPFFVAEGWHTRETIPDDLGINRPDVANVTDRNGQRIHYADPVGTFPEVADIIVERAREAGAVIRATENERAERGVHAPEGASAAYRAFATWVDEGGARGRAFLQLQVLRRAPGRYRLRHAADAAMPAAHLTRHTDPYRAREIAQLTGGGAHRPLKTSPNLRRGWTFEDLDADDLRTALDFLYPACVAHWHAEREATLSVTPWPETAGRQSGIYAGVRQLEGAALGAAIHACCGDEVCLRRVRWAASPDAGGPMGDAMVPCPEACSLFISFAREMLAVEQAPSRDGDDGSEAGLPAGSPGAVREGDFANPANERRVRYLSYRRDGE